MRSGSPSCPCTWSKVLTALLKVLPEEKHSASPLDWTWPLPTYRRMRYPVDMVHWHLHKGEVLRSPTSSGGPSHPHLRLSKVSHCWNGSLQKCCLKLPSSAVCHQPTHAPVSSNPLAHQARLGCHHLFATLVASVDGTNRQERSWFNRSPW